MTEKTKLTLDDKIYSEEALRLAAYVFEDRFPVTVKRRGAVSEVALPAGAEGEFLNEALNQQCRLDLGRKNSKVARMIVTRMLLSASGEGGGKGGGK